MDNGILTFWLSDVHKLKSRLEIVEETITQCKLNPLIKRSVLADIKRIFELLRKGRKHDSGNQKGRGQNKARPGKYGDGDKKAGNGLRQAERKPHESRNTVKE